VTLLCAWAAHANAPNAARATSDFFIEDLQGIRIFFKQGKLLWAAATLQLTSKEVVG